MSDLYPLVAPRVDAQGADLTQVSVQLAFNQLAGAVRIFLNQIAAGTVPSGPAGGDLSGTYPNPTVAAVHAVAGTIDGVVIGGVVPEPGTFTTLAGTSLFASGGAIPPVTATGTQIYNSPNPTIQFIDSIRSANNKNAYVQWGATVLAFGFANDTFTGFTNALTITGGQASGISGVTSTSGTGSWAHTGGFSATGGINSTSVGATTPSTGAFTSLSSTSGALNGTIGATTKNSGAFTTVTATTPIGVGSGGTGLSTLPAHAVLLGEGASSISSAAPSTAGFVLTDNGAAADPTFQALPTLTGRLIGVQRITATGTYTPTAGTNSVIVRLVGGGGGGGGVAATGASTGAAAAGGGSGAYAEVRLTSAFSGVTVTIGALGSGAAAGANQGATGGQSTFGSLITCPGGIGGVGAPASSATNAVTTTTAAAIATTTGTGLLLTPGSVGGLGVATGVTSVSSGFGGGSPFGPGAPGVMTTASGQASISLGSGGSGAAGANAAAQAGGNGAAGLCVVFEYS